MFFLDPTKNRIETPSLYVHKTAPESMMTALGRGVSEGGGRGRDNVTPFERTLTRALQITRSNTPPTGHRSAIEPSSRPTREGEEDWKPFSDEKIYSE